MILNETMRRLLVATACATVLAGAASADDGEDVTDPGAEPVEYVEDGAPVPYGPEDCIDCNVGPTTVGGPEVQRDGPGATPVLANTASTTTRPMCDSLSALDMTPCTN
jgi:hypothetical protein